MPFDQIIDRKHTYSLKWDKYKNQDILPLWVADTEFRCPEPILDAIKARTDHGLLGYTLPAHYTPANQAIARWLQDKHDWQIQPEWIVWMPGVVPAFNVACQAYCEAGDKVIVQTPNYPPLLAAPSINHLDKIEVGTIRVTDETGEPRWTIDFDALEQAAADPKAKLLIMCNPMNPVGSVLTQDELERISDICNQHAVTLCSDEIHCDLILDPQAKHIPAGSLAKLQEQSVTLMAPSKTFNIAGLGASFAIIPNAKVRAKFTRAAAGIMPWVQVLGLVATEAAFTLCDDWHQQLLTYLRTNRDYLVGEINKIEGLTALTPQATFLLWVDGSGLGVESPQKHFESLGIGPSPGADFGAPQCIRLNYGCPKSYLKEAISRLHKGI